MNNMIMYIMQANIIESCSLFLGLCYFNAEFLLAAQKMSCCIFLMSLIYILTNAILGNLFRVNKYKGN